MSDVVDEPHDRRMIAAEDPIDSYAGDHTNREPDQNSGVKRHAFRLIGCLFVEIGSYFTFERITFDFFVVSFVRHRFSLD
jgi:hypothetical protein